MEYTWRWYGPNDPITLSEIRQTGASGVVTALHEIDNATVWSREAISARRAEIEAAGLTWSVVESVPITDAVKLGTPEREADIATFCQTLCNLAAAGIDVVCYNFMPVADWTRTDLAMPLPGGGTALSFDQTAFAAFDLYLLERPGAGSDYSAAEQSAARAYLDTLDGPARTRLIETVTAGLPGADNHYDLAGFREAIARFAGLDRAGLRRNLRYFLEKVVPVAEDVGIRLAIHPDDPPRPLFGLPRVVSNAEDARWILDAVDRPCNGLTLCTGSYGAGADNDLVAMAREFAARIHFAHLRSVGHDPADPRSFHEADHLGGDVDMAGVMRALIDEQIRREHAGGARLPIRPDHGHTLLDDVHRETRPGYPLYGRFKGLSELRGLESGLSYRVQSS
ncbi:mannonate dehydratase [Salinisphaera sp. SWV1]|uniref:mannonate dehydratase n=1 Tax=Salinisphaera sp. SWV1 TaxID=3454139 RepID=UPI003F871702